jgi:hypothetical protein
MVIFDTQLIAVLIVCPSFIVILLGSYAYAVYVKIRRPPQDHPDPYVEKDNT